VNLEEKFDDTDPLPPIGMKIPTLEGVMKAEENDFIIKGIKGELYPCKPDIFEATYEAVEELTHGYKHLH